jgi:hypothetical protein
VSGFYRIGDPGEDTLAHINTGGRASGARCMMPRFEADDPKYGEICGRMSVALCDAPGCDVPICEFHQTKHPTKSNTDYCPKHKEMATQ